MRLQKPQCRILYRFRIKRKIEKENMLKKRKKAAPEARSCGYRSLHTVILYRFRIKRKREKENVEKEKKKKLHLRLGGAATEASIVP